MAKIFRGPERKIFSKADVSIGVLMHGKVQSHGDQVAQICAVSGQKLTFSQLLDQSLRIAAVFRDLGVGEGDAVSFVSENNLGFFPVVLGTFFTGATIAPVNPTYVERELEHCFLLSRPRLVVSSALVAPRVVPVVAQLVSAGKLPAGARSLVMGAASGAAQSLQQLASAVKSTQGLPVVVKNAADKTSFIMCSSGTTGLPKGVELTNKNVIETINFLSDPRLLELSSDDTLLGLLPFFHMYGLSMGLTALYHSAKVAIMPKFQETLFLNTLQNYKVTVAHLVPPLIVFLGKHPMVSKFDLSSLREIWSGAAPLSGEMQHEITKRLGKNLVRQAYGMTETTLAVAINPLEHNKIGASGKLVPGVMCKVIDTETGQMLGTGQAGELCIYGDIVMKGYKDNPKATDATKDNAGWVHTGDIGYFDEDEFLFIVDRVKELIKYKGFQVAPAELEALLLTHPGIQDAAVIGLPDEQAGELPLAFVILQSGAKLTEQQVIDFVAGQVSPSKRLHGGVKFVTSIPKTASGKILRRDLRNLVKSKAKL